MCKHQQLNVKPITSQIPNSLSDRIMFEISNLNNASSNSRSAITRP